MSKEVDPFRLNDLYPEADAIFSVRASSYESIKEDCVFVLDTNVLLLPYTISAKGIGVIGKAYEGLIKKDRLIVPGQVAREFARQRPERIKELYDRINQKRSKAPSFDIGSYPILEGVGAYTNIQGIAGKVGPEVKAYLEGLDEILRTIRGWGWDDPISLKYKALFLAKVIVDPTADRTSLLQEMKRRYANEIPPGYKDGGKADEGIGDFLIWKTILHVADERKTNVVFVTAEEKADWFHRSAGQSLYPRFELIAEFQRAAPGKSFNIVPFHELMEGLGTDEVIVEEIKVQEAGVKLRAQGSFFLHRRERIRLHEAGRAWVQKHFSQAYDMQFSRTGFPDVVLKSHNEETKIAIEIVVMPTNDPSLGLSTLKLPSDIRKTTNLYSKFIILFVSSDDEESMKSVDAQATILQHGDLQRNIEIVKLSVNGDRIQQR